jgi:hypothetical protein
MADNAGMAAIRAAAAKKQNMGGKVASALQGSKGSNGSSSNSGSPNNAIARRLAKGSSKSAPKAPPNDNDSDDQGSGY